MKLFLCFIWAILVVGVFAAQTKEKKEENKTGNEDEKDKEKENEKEDFDITNAVNNIMLKVQNFPDTDEKRALGKGFSIHKMDLLSKELQATGASIFKDLPYDECTLRDDLQSTTEDNTVFDSTESLYDSLSTSTKIDASLKGTYTLSASVSAVTNNMVSKNTEVSGMSLLVVARSMIDGLKKDCINQKPLAEEFKKDFENLPAEVDKPELRRSWRPYEVFLNKYGSHIVKEIIFGSSINEYVFAKSTEEYSQRDFTVKACVSLSGPTQAGEVGLAACSDISKEEISSSTNKNIIHKLVVRGGTAETRASLTGDLSREQIKKFLIEGQTDPAPILYTFFAIWKILQARYINTDSFAKAVNLEQFYKGYLQFGCTYEETRNGIPMQRFMRTKHSDPSAPTYGCYLVAVGCHHDDDCTYKASTISCTCSGDSCIRYKEEESNDGFRKKVAYAEYTKSAGVGCKLAFFKCNCRNRNLEEQVWTGENINDPIDEVNAIIKGNIVSSGLDQEDAIVNTQDD